MSDEKCTSGPAPCCGGPGPSCSAESDPLAWFDNMISNCLDYVTAAHDAGRPVVGIMCEYTPRELIMAAGAVPVCLCGGSAETIPAAEKHLPVGLCPLIKSTYGYFLEKSNPFLEMSDLIVGETTCDGKKKMYELMGATAPMYVLELPQKPDDEDALEHWRRELTKFKQLLESKFSVEITDDDLREAIRVMNRERSLRRKLAECMKLDPAPMTGRELLKLKSSVSGIPADLDQYERAIELMPSRTVECGASSRVRVLMTGVPIVHGSERVLDIVENNGGVVVCMENCTGVKPILEDVEEETADPLRALADKYFHLPCSVMTANDRRMDLLRTLAADYRPNCVIELVWQGCLTYEVESYLVKRLVEQDLGVPYLRIQTDYSPSDSARIAVRVEALFETVRHKQEAAK